MHEFGLLKNIMNKLDEIAKQEQIDAFEHIKIRIGALAHISAEHFREHFIHAAGEGPASHASLEIIQMDDKEEPYAQEIILESVKIPSKERTLETTATEY